MLLYVLIICLSVISSAYVMEKRKKPTLKLYDFFNNITDTNESTFRKTGVGILSGMLFSILETIVFYKKTIDVNKIIGMRKLISDSRQNIQWGVLYFVLSSFLFTIVQSFFNETNISILSQAIGLGIGFMITMLFIGIYHKQHMLVTTN
jgi:hypothetical protein